MTNRYLIPIARRRRRRRRGPDEWTSARRRRRRRRGPDEWSGSCRAGVYACEAKEARARHVDVVDDVAGPTRPLERARSRRPLDARSTPARRPLDARPRHAPRARSSATRVASCKLSAPMDRGVLRGATACLSGRGAHARGREPERMGWCYAHAEGSGATSQDRGNATTLRPGDRGATFQNYSKTLTSILSRPHPHAHLP